MKRRAGRTCALLISLSVVGLMQAASPSPPCPAVQRSAPAGFDLGILVIDLPSGRTLSVVQPDILGARVTPGGVLKVATLIAALESGVVSPATRFTCRRRSNVAGRDIVCAHPDLRRPMSAAEALAYSCDDFFANVGERLPRSELSKLTSALGLGPVDAGAPMALAAVGLDGIRATPEQLLRALVRAADPKGLRVTAETRQVLLEGLRGAARYGAARAIGDRGIDALASAGTPLMAGRSSQGLVLALSPSARASRAVAVLIPGGSDGDAVPVVSEALAQLIAGTYGIVARPDVRPSSDPRTSERPNIGAPSERPGAAAPAKTPAPQGPKAASEPSGEWSVRVGHPRLSGGYDLTQVPLEEYVARVVAGEGAARSAPAALEALAISVRTFAIANRGRHRGDGFDLCDLTHCQVMAMATPASRLAASATAGQILTWHGEPASIFYTACCGGQSELPSDVWPRAQNQPFLVRHRDEACRQLPEWASEVAASELLRALRNAGLRGDEIRDVRVAQRSQSGRASAVRIEGLAPETITGDDLRFAVGKTLGWQLIKSTALDVKRTSAGYRFTGRGSGHGVGLCVVGSARMAAEGESAARILAEYFPGTRIERLSRRNVNELR